MNDTKASPSTTKSKHKLTKIQLKEILRGLKTKNIPLKFEYFGKGAKRWDRLVESSEYGLGQIETELIKSGLDNFWKTNPVHNPLLVFDLGCGNAKKITHVTNHLSENCDVHLFLVDLSHNILKIAHNNVKCELGNHSCTRVLCDLEKSGDFTKIRKARLAFPGSLGIFFLLGNTIGNFHNPRQVLADIRKSMNENDILVVGTEVNDKINEKLLTEHYKNETIFKIQFSLLETLGVKKTDGKFNVIFSAAKSQVETYFNFSKSVSFEINGETISFSKGDCILLMISRKYPLNVLRSALDQEHFVITGVFTDEQSHYCLLMCKAV